VFRVVRAALLAAALIVFSAAAVRAQDAPAPADRDPAASRELVVGVLDAPPFDIKNEDGDWEGIAVALWREIARRQGYRYRFVEYDLETLLDALAAGKIDLAVGPLLVTADREQRFDMTSAFMHVSLAIATRPASWRNVLRELPFVFSGRILKWSLALFAAMVVVAIIVWALERRRNPAHFGGGRARGLGDAMWWSASTMSTVGYGDRTPITLGGRLVGVMWMFVSIVLVSTFTAGVTSVLTVSQLQAEIRTFRDLAGHRVGVVDGSAAAGYLAAMGITTEPYDDYAIGMQHVAAGDLDAFVGEWPVLRFLQRTSLAGRVSVVAEPFSRGFVGFALPRNSTSVRPIDVALLEVLADPAWQEIRRKYLGE
jgi:polar amino acid transport system substrate-binding protein